MRILGSFFWIHNVQTFWIKYEFSLSSLKHNSDGNYAFLKFFWNKWKKKKWFFEMILFVFVILLHFRIFFWMKMIRQSCEMRFLRLHLLFLEMTEIRNWIFSPDLTIFTEIFLNTQDRQLFIDDWNKWKSLFFSLIINFDETLFTSHSSKWKQFPI